MSQPQEANINICPYHSESHRRWSEHTQRISNNEVERSSLEPHTITTKQTDATTLDSNQTHTIATTRQLSITQRLSSQAIQYIKRQSTNSTIGRLSSQSVATSNKNKNSWDISPDPVPNRDIATHINVVCHIYTGVLPYYIPGDERHRNVIIPIYGSLQEPEFNAIDIGQYLGLDTSTITRFCEGMQHYTYVSQRYVYMARLRTNISGSTAYNEVNTWFITEPGVYRMVLECDSELADSFIDWFVFHLTKPIRQTNYKLYHLPKKPQRCGCCTIM